MCDRAGRVVAHADWGWEEWRVLGEYEGSHHAEVAQFDRDVDRSSLMGADGWILPRSGARHGRSAVVDRCRRALLSRGWRPPAGRSSSGGGADAPPRACPTTT
ncbi:hypothetical protein ASG41_16030 [Modestobacter sp. Leaf380]|nr:hypothetical protein ASG41_16030 [Modestobacter sp. Leaf380]